MYIILGILCCHECIAATRSKTHQARIPLMHLHALNVSHKRHYFMSILQRFKFFKSMESVIKQNLEVFSIQDNITKFLCERFQDLPYLLSNCYNLKNKIIKKMLHILFENALCANL